MVSAYELEYGPGREADVETELRLSPLPGEVCRRTELFSPEAAEVDRQIVGDLLNCPACGASMIGRGRNARYCSVRCRVRGNRNKGA